MGYWETAETRQKLKEAYAIMERRIVDKFVDRKQYKIERKIKRLSKRVKSNSFIANTPFEKMYKICTDFKKYYRNKSSIVILDRLRELSIYRIHSGFSYSARRIKKHRFSDEKECFVCHKKADVQHHIVLIKNGGYDNGINRIPLCNNCHYQIHPWMRQ